MNTKICSKCGIEKDLSEFYKQNKHKYGVGSECKECIKNKSKEYYNKCKEEIKIKTNTYRKLNINKYRKYSKEYEDSNKEKISQYKKEFRDKNIERYRQREKEYKNNNKLKIKESNKKYRLEHREEINSYFVNRRINDSEFKLLHNMRRATSRLCNSKFNFKKSKHTRELLVCDMICLRHHLEKQFRDGMNWDNCGKVWEIDHIIPISFFNLEDSTEQYLAFHYGNLQPLLKLENRIKSNNVPNENFRYF